MLELIGIDGMSSDEEVRTGGNIHYRIHKCHWRAATVTSWLRYLDSMHAYDRFNSDPKTLRGAAPRFRTITSLYSHSRRFIPGLPLNAYAADWYMEQTDFVRRNKIRADTTEYNFQHHEDIIQYVFLQLSTVTASHHVLGYAMIWQSLLAWEGADSIIRICSIFSLCNPLDWSSPYFNYATHPILWFYSCILVKQSRVLVKQSRKQQTRTDAPIRLLSIAA